MTAKPGIFKLLAFLAIFIAGSAIAQDDVDFTDNSVCLECHEGGEWTAPENSDRPRVHEDSGAFIQETHEMWSCNDCHDYITEIPHPEDIEGEVDCTNCHEATPEKAE